MTNDTKKNTKLSGIVAAHIAAVNAFDTKGIVSTFADDGLVNDNRREFWGHPAITAWIEKEIVGDKVTMEVIEVIERGSETIVRARYEGNFDKTNLPPEVILTNYFTIRDGKIVTLIVIFNR